MNDDKSAFSCCIIKHGKSYKVQNGRNRSDCVRFLSLWNKQKYQNLYWIGRSRHKERVFRALRAEEGQELFGEYERGKSRIVQHGREQSAAHNAGDARTFERRRKGRCNRIGQRL